MLIQFNQFADIKSIPKVLLLVLLFSCNSTEHRKLSEAEMKAHLTEVNRLLVKDEAKEIEEFISKHQFKMEKSGTGLRIQMLSKTSGKLPVIHEEVVIAYRVVLLDGTECYSAKEEHPFRFRLGEGQQPRGFEDALQQLPEGSRARVIVPSHLAYGMTGDSDKIPGGNALYYEVHLLKIQP